MSGRRVLAVTLLGAAAVAGCAQSSRDPGVRAQQPPASTSLNGSPRAISGPACPPPAFTAVPAGLTTNRQVAVTPGQPLQVGVVLTSGSNARAGELRVDVVPAAAGVVNGAGNGIPVSDGTEPHVARLQVADPGLGAHVLTFDGRDEQGRLLAGGDYQIYVVITYTTGSDCGPPLDGASTAADASPATEVAMIGTLHLPAQQSQSAEPSVATSVMSSPTRPAQPLATSTASAPSPAPARTLAAGHTLTEADDGAVVVMHVGQQLHLLLQPQGALGNWDVPILQGHSITLDAYTGGYPTDSPLDVTLRADVAGDTQLRTGTDLACFHVTPQCLPPQLVWSVTVHVLA